MKINRALDWNQVSIDLRTRLGTIGYNPDLQKMYQNIEKMVTELSKLEVTLRRTQKYTVLDDRVLQINNAIDHLEKLILMAQLMR
jgi:uncharacterized protein YaaN involved in tellurite resistance